MSAETLSPQPSRTELRRIRAEEQLVDAARVRAEIAAATVARDARTVRLRALRLAKEAADRELASALPPKPKARRRAVAAR